MDVLVGNRKAAAAERPPAKAPAQADALVRELPGPRTPDGEAQQQADGEDANGGEDQLGQREEVPGKEVPG